MSTTLAPAPASQQAAPPRPAAATFALFSGELDKLLMAFTLANGAAASGLRTTIFFAFWSLAALRTPHRAAGKNVIERLFGWLVPRGAAALPLSRLHMGGMGARMIRWRMRRQHVASLEEQIAAAQALGVQFVVCETSMQLMGFRREEMLPGVSYGGVAQCMAAATESRVAMVL